MHAPYQHEQTRQRFGAVANYTLLQPDLPSDRTQIFRLISSRPVGRFPGCPAGPMILGDAQRYVHQIFPQLEEVNIDLVWTPFWNPGMMSEEAKEELGIF